MYNILALDGGGIKGIYTLKILIRLIDKHPDLLSKCDLFAGTSTGAIIAGMLAYGMPLDDVFTFCRDCVGKVFKDSILDDIKDLGKILGADYDYKVLKSLLKKHVEDVKLGDLSRKLLIPTFDLDNEASENRTWKPKYFNNLQDSDSDELLRDVIIRSAAAPTYFPVYQGYADGGLVCNSPAVSAVCQAIDSGVELKDISVLSIGTGYSPTFVSGKRLDWGLAKWAPLLMDVVVDSMAMSTNYQCKKLLKDSYLRINSVIGEKVALDDDGKVSKMIDYADAVELDSSFSWLSKNW
jgi:uncharacterized protein